MKKIINKFNIHNKITFNHKKSDNYKKIFLIEFNGWPVIHIIFSYIINYFKKDEKCRIVAYEAYDILNRLDPPKYSKYLWSLGIFLNLKTFKVFKFLGTDDFIKPIFSKNLINKAKKFFNYFINNKPSLKKLENLKVNNNLIGDLIYDSYLKKYSYTTINLNSKKFQDFFIKSLLLFFFWEEYFKKNFVAGICVCHAVYLTGIPLRIAHKKKIRCFSASNMNLYNLTTSIDYKKKINGSDSQFLYYKKIAEKLVKKSKKKIKIQGKKILNNIINGKSKYFYMPQKTYSNTKVKKKSNGSNKVNVVIFTHDFVDSPHIYGNHFFTDFKEWLNYLSKIIKKSDYNWFIKDHPTSNDITKKELDIFIKNNPKVIFLDKNFKNNRLISLGIDYVLTVYGSIASEVPIYGINTINATRNNPHFNFKFSINPKNINDYKKTLLNLRKKSYKINKDDLYLYHYIKDYLFKNSLFFKDPQKYFMFYDNKPLQYTNKMYELWLSDFDQIKHKKIVKNLNAFIKSGDYIYLKND